MYRRYTTGGESWSVCPYYYTHNNGSSDDILLHQHNPLKVQKQRRRNSCPAQHWRQHQDGYFLKRNATSSFSRHKKRETLAIILSNMSKRDNEKLDKKWQSIDAQMSSLRTNTTLCEMNDTAIDIEYLGSGETTQSARTPLKPNASLAVHLPLVGQDDNDVEKQMDMWFFLFGFLCFPLWWVSAWRFFTDKKGKKNSKARAFQIINLWMTMGSLILLGLMIGLTVTFAS
ncbi:hypothetical protein K501DRAFT_338036 [Backusella circina FSU 941]|nr:hypothetical protein K501DRAFT_338036 [Backusella circina FSU 941]